MSEERRRRLEEAKKRARQVAQWRAEKQPTPKSKADAPAQTVPATPRPGTPKPAPRATSQRKITPKVAPKFSWEAKPASEMSFAEKVALGRVNADRSEFDANAYFRTLADETRQVGHRHYNPYQSSAKSTQKEAMEFFGVDRFDPKWFEDNAHLRDYVTRLDVTDTMSTAGKGSWTKEQWAGYYYENLLMDEERTRQAEGQWKQLRGEAEDYFRTQKTIHGKAPDIDDFLSHIDVSRYSALQTMDESRNLGLAGSSKVVRLNRPIGYSREALTGLYHALANGRATDHTDYFNEAVLYHMQPVKRAQEQPKAGYGWEAALPDMTGEAKAEEARRIAASGDRAELHKWNYLNWRQETGEAGGYFGGMYIDAAFFEKYDPIFGPIIDSMRAYDPNGKGAVRKPGTGASEMEQAAYEYYTKQLREPDTRAVEDEWDELCGLIAKEVGQYGELARTEFANGYASEKIQYWLSEFPTLARYLNNPDGMALNRPIFASKEALTRAMELAVKDVALAGTGETPPDRPGSPTGTKTPVLSREKSGEPVPGDTLPGSNVQAENQAVFPGEIGPGIDGLDYWKVDLNVLGEKYWPMLLKEGLITEKEIETYKKTKAEQSPTEHIGMAEGAFESQNMIDNPEGYTPQELRAYLKELRAALMRSQSADAGETGAMWQDKYIYEIGVIEGALEDMDEPLVEPVVYHTDAGDPVVMEPQKVAVEPPIETKPKAVLNELPSEEPIAETEPPAMPELDADLMGVAASAGLLNKEDAMLVKPVSLFDLDDDQVKRWAGYLADSQAATCAQYGLTPGDTYNQIQARIWEIEAENARLADEISMRGDADGSIAAAADANAREIEALTELRGYLDGVQVAKGTADAYLTEGDRPIWTRQSAWRAFGQYFRDIADPQAWADAWEEGKDSEKLQRIVETEEALNKIITGQDVQGGTDILNQHAKADAEEVGALGETLDAELKRVLGNDVPEWASFYFKGAVINAAAARTGSVQGGAGSLATGFGIVRDAWAKINAGRYSAVLGDDYTFAAAQAIDPVLAFFTRATNSIDEAIKATSPDMSESGYGAQFTQNALKMAIEMKALGAVGGKLAKVFNSKVLSKARPYIEKLPAGWRKIAKFGTFLSKKGVQYLPYEMRAYSDYAEKAREEGYGESDAAAFGMYGAMTQGAIEGVLGDVYGGIANTVPKAASAFVRNFVSKSGSKILAKGGDLLKVVAQRAATAVGEALEESTEVLSEDIGRAWVLDADIDFAPYVEAGKDLLTGQFDRAKYEGTKVDEMIEAGIQGGITSFYTSFLFGLGGGGNLDLEVRADALLDAMQNDAQFDQSVQEAIVHIAENLTPKDGSETTKAGEGTTLPTETDVEEASATNLINETGDGELRGTKEEFTPQEPQSPSAEPVQTAISPKTQVIVDYMHDAEAQFIDALVLAQVEDMAQQAKAEGLTPSVTDSTSTESRNITRLNTELGLLAEELDGIGQQVAGKDRAIVDAFRTALELGLPTDSGTVKQTIHNMKEAQGALLSKLDQLAKKQREKQAELQNAERDRADKAAIEDKVLRKGLENSVRDAMKRRGAFNRVYNRILNVSDADKLHSTEMYLDAITKLVDPMYEDNKSVQAPEKSDSLRDDALDEKGKHTSPDAWVLVDQRTYNQIRGDEFNSIQKRAGEYIGTPDSAEAQTILSREGYRVSHPDSNDQQTELPEDFREVGRNDSYIVATDTETAASKAAKLKAELDALKAEYNNLRDFVREDDVAAPVPLTPEEARKQRMQQSAKRAAYYRDLDKRRQTGDRTPTGNDAENTRTNIEFVEADNTTRLMAEDDQLGRLDDLKEKIFDKQKQYDVLSRYGTLYDSVGKKEYQIKKAEEHLDQTLIDAFSQKDNERTKIAEQIQKLIDQGKSKDSEEVVALRKLYNESRRKQRDAIAKIENRKIMSLKNKKADLEARLDDLFGRYVVVDRRGSAGYSDSLVAFRTNDLNEAIAYANEHAREKEKFAKMSEQETEYYVRESKLWRFMPSLANELVLDGKIRSYDEYLADTTAMVDAYARENELSPEERQQMLEEYTFKSRMSRYDEAYVDIDRNEDFVLITKNDNYPGMQDGVNEGLTSIGRALEVLRAAVRTQENDSQPGMRGNLAYHDPAYKMSKASVTATSKIYREKKAGLHYLHEGEVKYTVAQPDGRRYTYSLGEWDGSANDRHFAPYEEILRRAEVVHVNAYYNRLTGGKKTRYTFTLEANRGQGSNRPNFDYETAIGRVAPQEDVARRFERAYDAWARVSETFGQPGGELRSYLRNYTFALMDKLDAQLAALPVDSADPATLEKRRYLSTQSDLLQALFNAQAERASGVTAQEHPGVAALETFERSNPAYVLSRRIAGYIGYMRTDADSADPASIEIRIAYAGQEQDVRSFIALAERYKAAVTGARVNGDEANALYGALIRSGKAIGKKLRDARVKQGGGALLSEYNQAANELKATIDNIKQDPTIDDITKVALLKTKRGQLKTVNTKIAKMEKAGVTLDTPGEFDDVIKIMPTEEAKDPENVPKNAAKQDEQSDMDNQSSEAAREENQPETTAKSADEIDLRETRSAHEIVQETMARPERVQTPQKPAPTGSALQDKINQEAYDAEMKRTEQARRDQAWRDKTRSGATIDSPEDTAPLAEQQEPDMRDVPAPEMPTNEMGNPLEYMVPEMKNDREVREASKTLDVLEATIAAIGRNLDEMAARGELNDVQRQRKETLIGNRKQFKAKRDAIVTALSDPEVQTRIRRQRIVEDAEKTGLSTTTIPHMRSSAIQESIALTDAWIGDNPSAYRDGRATSLSDAEILSWANTGRTEEKLLENLMTANAISADVRKMRERLDVVESGIAQLQEELSGLAAGADDTDLQARLARLMTNRDALRSTIEKSREAARSYYSDASVGLGAALKGERQGKLPVSVVNKVIAMAKQASSDRKRINPAKILTTNLGNAKQIVESYFGEYAPIMNKLYVQPVIDANTKIAAARATFNERIKNSGITKDNSEIAHKYAEGIISDYELRGARADDHEQIVRGVQVFREAYDDLLDQVNATLTKNGYEPVPKRENYFPHFREDASTIDVVLGQDIDEYTLKTSLYGRTGEFRPGKPFNAHFLRRQGNETVYDLLRGYEHYIDGALNVIHQTDNILRLRQLESELRAAFDIDENSISKTRMGNFTRWVQEYANTLSGKKGTVDYAAESVLKRQVYTAMSSLRSMRGAALVVGNLSVAVSNIIPIGQALGFAPKQTLGAMGTMLRNTLHGKDYFGVDGFEARSSFLTRRFQGKAMDTSWLEKFQNTAQVPAIVLDRLAANVVVRAIYEQGISRGYTEDVAMVRADDIAYRMMASSLRGESGSAQSSQVGGMVLQFAREPINNLFYIFHDAKALKGAVPKLLGVAITLLFNWLFNKVTGKETALDPIGATEKAVMGKTEGDAPVDVAKEVAGNLWNTGWPVGETLPMVSGITNAVGALGSVIEQPGDDTSWEKLLSASLNWTPGGAQIERTARGAKMIFKQYSESKEGYYRYAFDDPSAADVALALTMGENSTSQGKALRDVGGKPMTKTQDAAVREQMAAGLPPSEAEANVRSTQKAKELMSEVADAQKRGDAETYAQKLAESADERAKISVPSGMPSWATHASQEPYMQKAIALWQEHGASEILPKIIPDTLDGDNRRVDVAPEDRAELENLYMRYYRDALERLPEGAALSEVKRMINKAYTAAKDAYIKRNYRGD